MSNNIYIIIAFILYLFAMMVGAPHATRRIISWESASWRLGDVIGAEASDMSGWMLMGLPAMPHVAGLNAGVDRPSASPRHLRQLEIHRRPSAYRLAEQFLTLPDFSQSLSRRKQSSAHHPSHLYFDLYHRHSGFVMASASS